MSRKQDWADKEARTLGVALGLNIENKMAMALIAASLRLAFERGAGDGIDRVKTALGITREQTNADGS